MGNNDGTEACCCLAASTTTAVVAYQVGKSQGKKSCSHSREISDDIPRLEDNLESEGENESFLLGKNRAYQKVISPEVKRRLGVERICKYTPSCSEYARGAIEKYGEVKGSVKAITRLLRCNPFSEGGYDPVI